MVVKESRPTSYREAGDLWEKLLSGEATAIAATPPRSSTAS